MLTLYVVALAYSRLYDCWMFPEDCVPVEDWLVTLYTTTIPEYE
jgi:hypothetical protein